MQHTAKTKRKLSRMRKGKKNPFFGRTHTPAAKEKMSLWTRTHNARRQYEIMPCSLKRFARTDAAYVAGLIDGEGSITVSHGRPVVYIYNTSLALMEWIVAHVGGAFRVSHCAGRSPCHVWTVASARNVHRLLSMVLEFLVIKRDKALNHLRLLTEKYGDRI